MNYMFKTISKTIMFTVLLTFFMNGIVSGQSTISCKIDGGDFNAKVEEALLVKIGNDNFIQIKSTAAEKILYVYIKTSKLKGDFPITLNFADHDSEKGEMPDAEVVWVPDGPDNPQWNSIDGEMIVSQFDPDARTITATFEYEVQKVQYGSKSKNKTPNVEITNGKIEALHYGVDQK